MITPTNGIAAMMTLTNGNTAVIIDNWRRDHEFVIIASSLNVSQAYVLSCGVCFCDFAITCPVRTVIGLNVAVLHGRVRVRVRPGFRVSVSRVSRVLVKVSVRVRGRL